MLNLSTDKSLDKICELLPYIENLKDNEHIIKCFESGITKIEGEDEKTFNLRASKAGIDKIFKIVPILLKENREDVYGIVSIMNDKDIQTIKEQKITVTIKEIKELITNEEIRELFF